jgi:cellulose synthase/poly-beta-1,6-N-acetylglucosamine synthase-like glycosyltransferase
LGGSVVRVGAEQRGTRGHVFATRPAPPERLFDREITQSRFVVALIVAIVVGLVGAVTGIGVYFAGSGVAGTVRTVELGPVDVSVSTETPSRELILTALLVTLGVAVVAVLLEAVTALLTLNPRRYLLGSHRSGMGDVAAGPPRLTIVVPAHDEAATLPVTLGALAQQTRLPDRVIVVADNCTDATTEVARGLWCEVFETVGNVHRKAGALNQALGVLLPTMGSSDLVLVMDADTSLRPAFLEVAYRSLAEDPELTAVGGLFYGDEGPGMLGQFQRNEYARYSLQIRARHGRVFVLTGTATVFRADALLDVAAARGVFIPGTPGHVYDTAALTEDNELTLALKTLGAVMVSPPECGVVTEIMPTWRNLWVQRKRWQRGAVENLAAYGVTPATARYWTQQVGLGFGVLAFALYLLLMGVTIFSGAGWTWFSFWIVIGLIFLAERVITAWSAGWRARGLALLLFPELAYAVFLHVVFVKCLLDIALARRTTWGHVHHTQEPQASAGAPMTAGQDG